MTALFYMLLIFGPQQMPVSIPLTVTTFSQCKSIVESKVQDLQSRGIQVQGSCIDTTYPR